MHPAGGYSVLGWNHPGFGGSTVSVSPPSGCCLVKEHWKTAEPVNVHAFAELVHVHAFAEPVNVHAFS